MADTKIAIDPNQPIDLNVIVHSPHKVAFRFWSRSPASSEWRELFAGTTDDREPDHRPFHAVVGARFAYWVGIGGNPVTSYRVIITLAQAGAVLANGAFVEAGLTDGSGIARAERQDHVFS